MGNKLQYPKDPALNFEEKHRQFVLQAIKKDNVIPLKKAPQKKSRKALYGVITAVALILFFIVSSYVSPAMAKVTARIPYFSLFIKQEEYKYAIYDVISEVVQEKKYDLQGMDVIVPDRKLTITLLGTKTQVEKLKANVIKEGNAALIAQNFGRFDITVKQAKADHRKLDRDLSPEEKQNEQKTNDLQAKVENYLKSNNYVTPFPPQVRINKIEHYMYVSISKAETRDAELEQAMRDLSKPYGEDFKIDIRKSDPTAREQELRWGNNNIIGVISSGLMENKAFKVTGFSYSFHPLPLQIEVKIAVKSTESEAKELADKIKNEIDTFIQTDEITKEVRNDPYIVTVYGKDKKKIN